ncbi:type IX secretion system protein PorG [Robertkochia sediminum]|uniref:type IX secretion system protein PorG n=1 Tax=Robertkochia sediminum TaxID=2785326 RepID=UPI0019320343|nr:DUF6089 family protein [Robertkochia sediminum]MBL7472410.1 hypothetical protein [Robertkochia sediminum]
MRALLIAILLCAACAVHAQTYELGVFLGGSNTIGDVGSERYINPNELAVGGIGKWNLSDRYSYRVSVIYSELSGDDADASSTARNQRNYRFTNKALEVSLGMEFNFVEFNLHDFRHPFTPYLHGGVSVLMHDNLYYNAPGTAALADGRKSTVAFPMTVGVKGKVGQHFVLGAEVGARYALTDNLDGSNPGDQAGSNFERFGNLYSDDWYVFTGVTLTYTFIRKPCYSCYE